MQDMYQVSCDTDEFFVEGYSFQDAIARAVKFLRLVPGDVVTMELTNAVSKVTRRVDVKLDLHVYDV